jgi:hypothetical protein
MNEVPPETLVLVMAKPRGETFIGGESAQAQVRYSMHCVDFMTQASLIGTCDQETCS